MCMLRMMVARLSKSRTIRHSKQESVDLSDYQSITNGGCVRTCAGRSQEVGKEGAARAITAEGETASSRGISLFARRVAVASVLLTNRTRSINIIHSLAIGPGDPAVPVLCFFLGSQVGRIK